MDLSFFLGGLLAGWIIALPAFIYVRRRGLHNDSGETGESTKWPLPDEGRETGSNRVSEMYCTLHHLGLGVARLSLEGIYLSADQVYADLLGCKVADLVGNGWRSTVMPEDLPEAEKAFAEMLSTGIGRFEAQARSRVRERVYKEVVMLGQKDDNGNLSSYLCITRDISQRKRLEMPLGELAKGFSHLAGKEFFEAVTKSFAVQSGLDYVFVGRYEQVKESVNIFGGWALGERMEPFSYQLENTPCREAIEAGTCFYREHVAELFPDDLLLQEMAIQGYIGVRILNKSGATLGLFVALHRQPIQEEEFIQQLFTVYQDRLAGEMQRVTAEESLRASEARYRLIVDSEPACIKTLDSKGTLLDMNPAGLEVICADSIDQVRGLSTLDLIAPEYRAEYRFGVDEVFRGKVTNQIFEIIDLKGNRHWMEQRSVPLRDGADEKRVTKMLALTQDITEKKREESERQSLQLQLGQAQKMETVGQLAGGIAHDFNNIMAAITLNLDLLETDEFSQNNRVSLEELKRCAERASTLTRQLLTFSRQSVTRTEPIDLNDLIANLASMLERVLGENYELVFDRYESLPTVKADLGMLEQVLTNLVVNARDASPDGGRITIRLSRHEFDEGSVAENPSRQIGDFICVSVIDQGIGIDPVVLPRIFEPFYTTKEVGQGTGLGLATVHGIVTQHGGWLEVDSTVNEGTTMAMFFPLEREALDKSVEGSGSKDYRGSETILLVEDEAPVRRVIKQALSHLGYSVLQASDGREALDIWNSHSEQIELIITDMIMPGGMTGADLTKAVRKERSEVKVMISSGYSPETLESLNHVDFLQKPYDLDHLGKAIRTCLDGDYQM